MTNIRKDKVVGPHVQNDRLKQHWWLIGWLAAALSAHLGNIGLVSRQSSDSYFVSLLPLSVTCLSEDIK